MEILSQTRYPTSSHFFGKGFLERMKENFEASKYDQILEVIVSSELTPLQYFNINSFLPSGLLLVDKFQLVLTIFEHRASSIEAKLQIELARLQYNEVFEKNWYLSKMIGGDFEATGGTERRGFGQSGESKFDEIVADHRKKEAVIKKKLEKIKLDRKVRRKARTNSDMLKLSLVGYTNAGKSTLMNALTKSEAITENQLFTTLGTTTRSFKYFDLPVMVTDTVGFLEDLPTRLIDAFRSTLEESVEGDFILLILDASDSISELERKLDVTISILKEIDVSIDELIFIFNKIDKLEKNEKIWINEWFDTTEYSSRPRAFVSALKNDLHEFLAIISSITHFKHFQVSFPDSFKKYKSEFYNICEIMSEKSIFNEKTNLNYTVLDLRTRREVIFFKEFAKLEQECLKNNLPRPTYVEISSS